MSQIKLGVTLYSFSTEYCKGEMNLEDCIRTARALGAEGFEDCGHTDDPFLSIYQR